MHPAHVHSALIAWLLRFLLSVCLVKSLPVHSCAQRLHTVCIGQGCALIHLSYILQESTINNLEQPVTKTAAQTMKIVYTLTDIDDESEEEE